MDGIVNSIHSIIHWHSLPYSSRYQVDQLENLFLIGGGKFQITYNLLCPYLLPDSLDSLVDDGVQYRFVSHLPYQDAINEFNKNKTLALCCMPLGTLVNHLTYGQAKAIAKMHSVFIAYKAPIATILHTLNEHLCSKHCYDNLFVLKRIATDKDLEPGS